MKNFIALMFTALSLNASASVQNGPEYFQPEFTISKISPMCPSTIPQGAQCAGYGSIVTITANLGCLDKIVFHEVTTFPTRSALELHSLAVALRHPDSDRVRCARANTISKTISVPEIGAHIVLINDVIQN